MSICTCNHQLQPHEWTPVCPLPDPLSLVYIEEAGPTCWVERKHGIAMARHVAAAYARETMGELGRARYIGPVDASLHDHEDPFGCEGCPTRPAFKFEVYEA